MNILLTGATGFVGSYMLEALLEAGHTIAVVKRSFSQVDRIKNHLEECKVYDLDKIEIEKIYEENMIECIVHCATYYGRDDRQCIKNIESNLLFPLQMLSLGMEHGVRHFINTDSFFANQIETDQDLDQKLYMCGYTLSKRQFRQWGRMFVSNYGIDFINMKEETSKKTLLSLLENELRKDPIPACLVDMTKLSLVEITRKKKEKSLAQCCRECAVPK